MSRQSWLLLRQFFGGLSGIKLFAPPGGFVGVVGGFVELDEAFEGFGEAGFCMGTDVGFALVHSLVAHDEERLGFGVLLQAEEGAAELRF